MENKKLTREQLINRVAGRLFVYRPYDNLSQMPQYLQDIYKEKAKIVIKRIEHCIDSKFDMREYIDAIGDKLQRWFVAINVASNTLLSPEAAYLKGTLTKDEAQGKNIPNEKHSDLFKYLGQEGVNKIGAEKLLAYKDLPLEDQSTILIELYFALNVVKDRANELKDKAEENKYSLQTQIETINDEVYKVFALLEKEDRNQGRE